MTTSTDSPSEPNSSGRLVYSAARMRAILVGVRNSVNATSQAIMFTSSLEVSATMHLGLGGAGRLEHGGECGVAGHGAHVETVLQVAQHVLVGIDDRDFVGLLARQVMGGGAADLAGAEDENFHGSPT